MPKWIKLYALMLSGGAFGLVGTYFLNLWLGARAAEHVTIYLLGGLIVFVALPLYAYGVTKNWDE
jgi:hypothetical protein